MLVPNGHDYDTIRRDFTWRVPEFYNATTDIVDRHVGRDNPALIVDFDAGPISYSFRRLHADANRMASFLRNQGLVPGDIVAVIAQPCYPVPVVHLGAWKAGMVVCPISTLFSADAICYRLKGSGAKIVFVDKENEAQVASAVELAANGVNMLVFDRSAEDDQFRTLLAAQPEHSENHQTRASDPCSLNFTSGTTGLPKGVLAPHSHILGQAAGMEYLYDFPQPGEIMWSTSDWSWIAGQMCTLMAGLFLGMTVVARPRAGFDAEDAYRVMAQHKVTHALLIPTMLKMMRQVDPSLRRTGELSLKVIATGSEPCGAELYRWVNETFGTPLNETFGQTECATMICNNERVTAPRHGSLGRPTPGLDVTILDPDGNELGPGEVGEIASRRPHPIIFHSYYNDPDATARKFIGNWMRTGDLGWKDQDGYFWYRSRDDDIITSSGYRIGPGEVEDALLGHPAVAMAAVIGLPDPIRTEVVSAFVVLTEASQDGANDTGRAEALREDIRDHVRRTLARHEVPRRIEFVPTLPRTTTGKLMRKELKRQVMEGAG